ncbi:MAG: DNA repair protein RadA [Spirochaetales bacterium]|nr:DNA repair protein RadA [Spirochaetales bacterium]
MAKAGTVFICSQCGHEESKWAGRCPECGEWNTFVESAGGSRARQAAGRDRPRGTDSIPLESLSADSGERSSSGIGEVDRVLGGGLVRGSSVLIGGEPGIGKSTLMLQVAAGAAGGDAPRGQTLAAAVEGATSRQRGAGRILYVTGEESAAQLKTRADRLGIGKNSVEVLCETDLESILRSLQNLKPVLVVVDSIQTLTSPELGNVPGTPNQIKYCCYEIISYCRERGCPVFLVAHVTKEGSIAGPKLIEHMVDTVLYFDQSESELRILRASKNRFGPVDEVGLFTMTARGLQEVKNPASLFIVQRENETPPGIVVAPVYEGSRVLMIEIQALVVPAKGAISRVFSDRIDSSRVSRVAAILEKHLSLRFSDQDIYVNVAGGLRIGEVGIELPLAFALYSARTSIPVSSKTAAAGELTLAGEVRSISHLSRRVRTAKEMGFDSFIGPASTDADQELVWTIVSDIAKAVKPVFA